MAVEWDDFFDIVKLYAAMYKKTIDFNYSVDQGTLNAMDTLRSDVDTSDELRQLIVEGDGYKSMNDTKKANYVALLNQYLVGDGAIAIQSSDTTATNVAGDVVTFMTRDSETVLSNNISEAITYSRSGDGTAAVVTNQQARTDTITCTCTTAQVAGNDMVFSVRSKRVGSLGTITGNTPFSDTNTGLTSITVSDGSLGNEWAVSDVITIEITSNDVSVLLSMFRDSYNVLLPNTASSPTISNDDIEVVSTFPTTGLYDGRQVILGSVSYVYDLATTSWVQFCPS